MWRTLRSMAEMGPPGYAANDHLRSGRCYIYEYPDRSPKLLKWVKPAYVPDYEQ
jgi:hypothetical protein